MMKSTVFIRGVQAVWFVGTLLYRGDYCAHITVCSRKDNIYLVVSAPMDFLTGTVASHKQLLRNSTSFDAIPCNTIYYFKAQP